VQIRTNGSISTKKGENILSGIFTQVMQETDKRSLVPGRLVAAFVGSLVITSSYMNGLALSLTELT
jgi:hypothetical protein